MNLAIDAITKTVPINVFNRGLAGKVFDDVKANGAKVVMKNNTAEAVLISPSDYIALCEEIENLNLLLMAKERLEKEHSGTISQADIDKEFGFSHEDLAGYDEGEFE